MTEVFSLRTLGMSRVIPNYLLMRIKLSELICSNLLMPRSCDGFNVHKLV